MTVCCALLALAGPLAGCNDSESIEITIPAERDSIHSAYCQATVGDHGELDIEGEYLPAVVTCENGAADYEALKAQAVAARSYLYYRLDRIQRIGDSQRDQVYTCRKRPSERARQAVRDTSGQVLHYRDTQVAAFYVAGALQQPPGCAGGGKDPTATEPYVTYNAGRRGDEVVQTHLGALDDYNRANRGCMSQNGSHCLAHDGWLYPDILRFYYGDDIELVQVRGPCIQPLPSDAPPPPRERLRRVLPRALITLAAIGLLAALWWQRKRRRA